MMPRAAPRAEIACVGRSLLYGSLQRRCRGDIVSSRRRRPSGSASDGCADLISSCSRLGHAADQQRSPQLVRRAGCERRECGVNACAVNMNARTCEPVPHRRRRISRDISRNRRRLWSVSCGSFFSTGGCHGIVPGDVRASSCAAHRQRPPACSAPMLHSRRKDRAVALGTAEQLHPTGDGHHRLRSVRAGGRRRTDRRRAAALALAAAPVAAHMRHDHGAARPVFLHIGRAAIAHRVADRENTGDRRRRARIGSVG